MIKCRIRDLESLHHSINVAKAIIQHNRDVNLRFTDHLFTEICSMWRTVTRSRTSSGF